MDTVSALIGIVLLLLFVGPILFIVYKQANKDRKRLKSLKILGDQNHMNLDQIELTNSFILGLDSASKKLLIAGPQNQMQYDIIDLRKINRSIVVKNGLPLNGNKEKTAVTHISLDLLKENSEKVTGIVFYDEDDNSNYDAEILLNLAIKWDKLIKMNLSA